MIKFLVPFLWMACFSACSKAAPSKQPVTPQHDANKMIVPIGGNTWTLNGATVTNNGLTGWESTATKVKTYVFLSQGGTLHLSLNMNPGGQNRLMVTIQGLSKELTVEGSTEKEFYVGKWENVAMGYATIELQGISKSTVGFGTVS